MTDATKRTPTHTPGPWSVEDAGERLYIQGSDVATARDIALVYRPGRRDTADADARLIAAAPELLEAAKASLQDQESMKEPYRNEALCDALRGVIAKAE